MDEYGGTFHFHGDIGTMKMRVSLIQCGSVPGVMPSIADRPIDRRGSRRSALSVQATDNTVDQLMVGWQHKLQRPNPTTSLEQTPSTEESSRAQLRLFTYVQGDELPEYLQSDRITTELVADAKSGAHFSTMKRSKKVSPVDSWRRENAIVDLPVKGGRQRMEAGRKTMYIMAYLGPPHAAEYDDLDEFVICRVSQLNDSSITFEPKLTNEGYRLESRYGVYKAIVTVLDDQFDDLKSEPSISSPTRSDEGKFHDAESFAIPHENSVHYTYHVEIERAVDFSFDGLYVEYKVDLPSHLRLTNSDEAAGRSVQCFQRYDDQAKTSVCHFSHLIEFTCVLDVTKLRKRDEPSWASLHLRMCSVDSWGRFYVAGYGRLVLPVQQNKTTVSVPCWRPVKRRDAAATLRELFVGQALDAIEPFPAVKQNAAWSKLGLDTEASGTVVCSVSHLRQSRRWIASEGQQRLRYGTMMSKIGLNSALQWRIMRVLMEFEEARRELLRIRASDKKAYK